VASHQNSVKEKELELEEIGRDWKKPILEDKKIEDSCVVACVLLFLVSFGGSLCFIVIPSRF